MMVWYCVSFPNSILVFCIDKLKMAMMAMFHHREWLTLQIRAWFIVLLIVWTKGSDGGTVNADYT